VITKWINKQDAVVSIFWGSLWGIVEATLGYLSHLVIIAPGFSGFIMFPIGFYFMSRAFRESGKLTALFGTAVTAASIKMVDIFLPALHPLKTINPAICIILEAIAVLAVLGLTKKQFTQIGFQEALIVSMTWRMVYLGYSFSLGWFAGDVTALTPLPLIRFLLMEPLVNAVLIIALLKMLFHPGKNPIQLQRSLKPRLSFTVLVLALLIHWLTSSLSI